MDDPSSSSHPHCYSAPATADQPPYSHQHHAPSPITCHSASCPHPHHPPSAIIHHSRPFNCFLQLPHEQSTCHSSIPGPPEGPQIPHSPASVVPQIPTWKCPQSQLMDQPLALDSDREHWVCHRSSPESLENQVLLDGSAPDGGVIPAIWVSGAQSTCHQSLSVSPQSRGICRGNPQELILALEESVFLHQKPLPEFPANWLPCQQSPCQSTQSHPCQQSPVRTIHHPQNQLISQEMTGKNQVTSQDALPSVMDEEQCTGLQCGPKAPQGQVSRHESHMELNQTVFETSLKQSKGPASHQEPQLESNKENSPGRLLPRSVQIQNSTLIGFFHCLRSTLQGLLLLPLLWAAMVRRRLFLSGLEKRLFPLLWEVLVPGCQPLKPLVKPSRNRSPVLSPSLLLLPVLWAAMASQAQALQEEPRMGLGRIRAIQCFLFLPILGAAMHPQARALQDQPRLRGSSRTQAHGPDPHQSHSRPQLQASRAQDQHRLAQALSQPRVSAARAVQDVRHLSQAHFRGFSVQALKDEVAVLQAKAQSQPSTNRTALERPPMGWNSWNHYGCNINEQVIRETADALVSSGLRDAGYKFLNIDDCWQTDTRDEQGVLQADPVAFPSGMKALGDYIHKKGLKFGIYSDAGAYTCAGRAGSLGFEEMDAKTFESWGVDYLKYDTCYPGISTLLPFQRYIDMGDALKAIDRRIIFSMCNWGILFPAVWARQLASADLWRTTSDIENSWSSMLLRASENNLWAQYGGIGGWNDPDILEVGNGVLTPGEGRVQFTLWCIMKAPLLIGCDVRNMSKETAAIHLNKEAISVNQDPLGVQGQQISSDFFATEIWAGPLSGGRVAVALVNKGGEEASISLDLQESLQLDWANYTVRDIWKAQTSVEQGHSLTRTVPSHDVAFLVLKQES